MDGVKRDARETLGARISNFTPYAFGGLPAAKRASVIDRLFHAPGGCPQCLSGYRIGLGNRRANAIKHGVPHGPAFLRVLRFEGMAQHVFQKPSMPTQQPLPAAFALNTYARGAARLTIENVAHAARAAHLASFVRVQLQPLACNQNRPRIRRSTLVIFAVTDVACVKLTTSPLFVLHRGLEGKLCIHRFCDTVGLCYR